MGRKLYIFICLAIIQIIPANAQWSILQSKADSTILVGADYIYNLQFDKASRCFSNVIYQYPDHPAGYFLDAMVEWWKINIFRETESYDEIFLNKIERVLNICNTILDSNPADIKALFFKGGALGFRGRFYALRESWFRAASDGKTAFDILLLCAEMAPYNHDIMLGMGIYNYFSIAFIEKYPYLKPVLLFLPKGDKKIGILQLQAAAKNARYASVEAKTVLLQVFYSFENNYPEALKVAETLHKKYPDNPYFHGYYGRCLVSNGMLNEWEKNWREILSRCISKKMGYNNTYIREALYYIGYAQMTRANYETSIKYLQKSLQASKLVDDEVSGFQVKAMLKIANCYDMLGKRSDAIDYYEKVLDVDEYQNSHDDAERYLLKPYGK